MDPDPGALLDIQAAYDRGRYLDAWDLARRHGEPRDWREPEALVLAARLHAMLGAEGQTRALLRLGRRLHPTHDKLAYFHSLWQERRVPPLLMLRALRARPAAPAEDPELAADWLALEAQLLARLREFSLALERLDLAASLCEDRRWLRVVRAGVLHDADRLEEALECAHDSLEGAPDYRAGIQSHVSLLIAAGRSELALAHLDDADARLQCGFLSWQRVGLLRSLDRPEEAWRAMDRAESLLPLMDVRTRTMVASARCDLAAMMGDRERSLLEAERARTTFHRRILQNARAAPDPARRVILPVPFVRQQHLTCGPATLAAVARFWGLPADQLEIVEEICYDGTPQDAERAWAEENGFVVGEFTVTWDSGVALLARGVPFTLATVEPDSAHLQAVIGFDESRRTFFIRDPGSPFTAEYLADELIRTHRLTGPRGMALVPTDRASLLDGLELPETKLRDRYHLLQRALRRGDREAACLEAEELAVLSSDHDLVHLARLSIASWDQNEVERLTHLRELARRHPDTAAPLLWALGSMRVLGRREDRLTDLEERVARVGSHPLFAQALADELAEDARQHARAELMLRLVLRRRPVSAGVLASMAELDWRRGRFDSALELYRACASLEDRDEQRTSTWFDACRRLGRSEEAIASLRERFEALGALSAVPARTLALALAETDRIEEALQVVARARQLRPEDGELDLLRSRLALETGDAEGAAEALEAARGRVREVAWLARAEALALYRGDLPAVLALLRRRLELQPAATHVHEAVERLLLALEGPEAALAHLEGACRRFPHHRELLRLRVSRLAPWAADAKEGVLREALALHPEDAWARRELALELAATGRLEEAFAELEEAAKFDPDSTSTANVRASLLRRSGRLDAARAELDRSLRIDAAQPGMLREYLDLAPDAATARGDIERAMTELLPRPGGPALLCVLRVAAQRHFGPSEALERLRAFHALHGDAWQAWTELAQQLVAAGRTDEAVVVANEGASRFPHLPAVLIGLAVARRVAGDAAGEREALKQALRVNPESGWAASLLASSLARGGLQDEAIELMKTATARDPHDMDCLRVLGRLLFERGRHDEAVAVLRRAMEADPLATDAWERLRDAATQAGQPDLALGLARDLAARRPRSVGAWLAVASTATRADQLDERLAALRHAIALAPRDVDVHDLLATVLCGARRFDEAIAACRPSAFGPTPPVSLVGRAAWVEWERGRTREAIELMRAAVRRDPTYEWGWWRLASWHAATGEIKSRRAATEALTRLRPTDADALLAHGRALAEDLQPEAALGPLEKAHALAPDDGEIAHALFRHHVSWSRLEAAERVVAASAPHLAEGVVDAWRFQIEVARAGDPGSAISLLQRALRVPGLPHATMHEMVSMAWRAREAARLLSAYADAACAEGAPPYAAAALIDEEARRLHWSACFRVLRRLPVGSASWHLALHVLVDAVGRSGPRRGVFRACWVIWRHARHVRQDDESWAKAGWLLSLLHLDRTVIRWMRDWEERDASEGWRLLNLAVSLRRRGRLADATRVSERALSWESEYGSHHLVLLAADAMSRHDGAAAEQFLARVRLGELNDFYRELFDVLSAALVARGGGTVEERRARWFVARAALRRQGSSADPKLFEQVRRAAVRFAVRETGAGHFERFLVTWV